MKVLIIPVKISPKPTKLGGVKQARLDGELSNNGQGSSLKMSFQTPALPNDY